MLHVFPNCITCNVLTWGTEPNCSSYFNKPISPGIHMDSPSI